MKRPIVLIIDDEELIREGLIEALSSIGIDSIEAESAESALEIMLNKTFDLILTDVRMKGMSGVDFVRKMKNELKNTTPIILMTGFSNISHDDAIKAGAIDLILKPFNIGHLLQQIQSALGMS